MTSLNRGRGRIVLLLALLAALAACRPLQPSAGKPTDLMERYVQQVIFDMRDGFVAADVPVFMKHVSDGFYGGRSRLEENLGRTLRDVAPVSLTVEIGTVSEEGSRLTASVKWRRMSGEGEGGKGVELRGESLLVFHSSDKITLVAVEGDALFGIEGF